MRLALALALWLALGAGAARAQDCRLALSLGLDVSSSVDAREYRLQTRGLAAALVAPEVQNAFLSVPDAPVALHVFEWSGWRQQLVRQDWVTIRSADDLAAVAGRLAAQERSYAQYPTALGFALLFGARALGERDDCRDRTLDVSGDGTNNDGVSPEAARRDHALAGITINGLVVGSNVTTLERYFAQFVIQGPGAFVEVAADYADFEAAMRRKLVREVGAMEMSGVPRAGTGLR